MKIFGLCILKQKTLNGILNKKEQIIDSMRMLTSHFIPSIEQLAIILREAKVGASSYGRRKKFRKLDRKFYELRGKIEEKRS